MVLSRRMFGLAAAAAPAIGPSMANQPFEAKTPLNNAQIPAGVFIGGNAVDPFSNITFWRDRLAALVAGRKDDLLLAMRNVERFDPDLMPEVSKSFSMAARIRLQAQRNLDRAFEQERSHIMKYIEELTTGSRP